MDHANGRPEDNTDGACCWETPFESVVGPQEWMDGRVRPIAPTSKVGAPSGAESSNLSPSAMEGNPVG